MAVYYRMPTTSLPTIVLAVLGFAIFTQPAAAEPQIIGETAKVVRQVDGEVEDLSRQLADADKVHRDELVTTLEDSATKIVFADGSKLSIGPDSEVLLDGFVYAGDTEDVSVISLTKGVIRFVSGSMRKEGVTIQTPAATIGIRGTNFAVDSDAAQQTTVLMDEEGATNVAGTCAECRSPLIINTGRGAFVPLGSEPQEFELEKLGAVASGDQYEVRRRVELMDELLRDSNDVQPGYRPDLPPYIYPILPVLPQLPQLPPPPTDVIIPSDVPPQTINQLPPIQTHLPSTGNHPPLDLPPIQPSGGTPPPVEVLPPQAPPPVEVLPPQAPPPVEVIPPQAPPSMDVLPPQGPPQMPPGSVGPDLPPQQFVPDLPPPQIDPHVPVGGPPIGAGQQPPPPPPQGNQPPPPPPPPMRF